jgi:hypothetical protein
MLAAAAAVAAPLVAAGAGGRFPALLAAYWETEAALDLLPNGDEAALALAADRQTAAMEALLACPAPDFAGYVAKVDAVAKYHSGDLIDDAMFAALVEDAHRLARS